MDFNQKHSIQQPANPIITEPISIEVNGSTITERYSDGSAFIVTCEGGITFIEASLPYSVGNKD